MGMSIEDYIKIIKDWLYKGTNGLTNTELGYMEGWFHKTDKKAFETAIAIMRKYQKIEEIVKFGNANELGFEYVGEKITEVLEDGNV